MAATNDQGEIWLASQLANQMMFIAIFEALGHTSADPDTLLEEMASLIEKRIDAFPIPGRSDEIIAKAKAGAKAVVGGVITSARNQKIQ